MKSLFHSIQLCMYMKLLNNVPQHMLIRILMPKARPCSRHFWLQFCSANQRSNKVVNNVIASFHIMNTKISISRITYLESKVLKHTRDIFFHPSIFPRNHDGNNEENRIQNNFNIGQIYQGHFIKV